MNTSLRGELDAISAWDRTTCITQWSKMTGCQVNPHLSLAFLRKALAFEHQCKARDGHNAATKRDLRRHLKSSLAKSSSTNTKLRAAPSKALSPGTQLIREWNGRIYRVFVVEDGFELDGRRYRSLTAVARHITGARWSGPRFFGLSKLK